MLTWCGVRGGRKVNTLGSGDRFDSCINNSNTGVKKPAHTHTHTHTELKVCRPFGGRIKLTTAIHHRKRQVRQFIVGGCCSVHPHSLTKLFISERKDQMHVGETVVLITGTSAWFVQQPHTPSYENCVGLQDTMMLITDVTTLLITSAYRLFTSQFHLTLHLQTCNDTKHLLNWLPIEEMVIFKIPSFVFRFFDGTLPPHLSSCLSVYTPSRTGRSSSDERKNLFLVQDGHLRALVTGRSLFRLSLSYSRHCSFSHKTYLKTSLLTSAYS